MKKKWDIWLIAGVLLLAGGIWLVTFLMRSEGAWAVVTVDGEEQGRYPLAEDLETEIVTAYGTNLLQISDGKARITEADCPDGLCVGQGAICYEGESIVCLPHRLTVTVTGGTEQDVDAVALRDEGGQSI